MQVHCPIHFVYGIGQRVQTDAGNVYIPSTSARRTYRGESYASWISGLQIILYYFDPTWAAIFDEHLAYEVAQLSSGDHLEHFRFDVRVWRSVAPSGNSYRLSVGHGDGI